ncbi:hypothetical protein ABID19_004763 [Mesorhizobium robiniae]|uniref:Uncharacterized protein n=1 Tax=Mesorhizobium robiniae TaxID=559315 RepID=A0ABV2GTU2_9HYPH
MAKVGQDDYCGQYSSNDDEVMANISVGNEEFYVRYRNWREAGEPSSTLVMLNIFGTTDEAEAKLKLGRGRSGKGGILKKDCEVFNTFVSERRRVGPVFDENFASNLEFFKTPGGNPALKAFRATLAKYFSGLDLSDDEKYIINGALFVRVDIDPVVGTGDRRLFAIPAYALLAYDQNLKDKAWDLIDERIGKALDVVRSNVINVTGAVHLRLGDDDYPIYEPIVIGDGMVIMGRA